jgi:hypothetical protein
MQRPKALGDWEIGRQDPGQIESTTTLGWRQCSYSLAMLKHASDGVYGRSYAWVTLHQDVDHNPPCVTFLAGHLSPPGRLFQSGFLEEVNRGLIGGCLIVEP